jgi:hypothetical protein
MQPSRVSRVILELPSAVKIGLGMEAEYWIMDVPAARKESLGTYMSRLSNSTTKPGRQGTTRTA